MSIVPPEKSKAPFIMVFDDSSPTQKETVIPALRERGLAGTFYLVPAAPWYDASFWASVAGAPGVVLANHTFSHAGATSFEAAEDDIARAEDFLDQLEGGRRAPGARRSFCIPGGVAWTVGPAQTRELLDKYDLVHRPRTAFYRADTMTPEELLGTPDRAIAFGARRCGEPAPAVPGDPADPKSRPFPPPVHLPGYLMFHGVGGDWLSTDRDLFLRLLDRVAELRDHLWVTDPVSWHLTAGPAGA